MNDLGRAKAVCALTPRPPHSKTLRAQGSPSPITEGAPFGIRISGLFQFSGIRISTCLLALAGTAAFAQSNGVPGPQDYATFSHFITDRNIFDPNRVPHSYNPRTSRYTPRVRHSNGTPGIQLVGTMSYEKGMFAFFGGNSAELSKVLSVGGKIADYTITEITPDLVRVESADKKEQANVKIGDGFRQDNGKWVFAKAGELPAAASAPGTTGASSTDSAGSTPAAPAAMGEPSDVLKRLIEQRAKENQ